MNPAKSRPNTRLYLDNAATSFPKPPAVMEAMVAYATQLGANAGRGAYDEAICAEAMIGDCRRKIARLLNAPRAESIVFTHNGTDALNLAILGLFDPSRTNHFICTAMDHNSVLRPMHELAAAGAELTIVPADESGSVNPDELRRAIRADTRLIAAPHASNVTGTIEPIAAIARVARERDVPLLVDAAQTAGHMPIDVQSGPIDLLAAPGHKGLLGPLGTGVLYIRPGLERRLGPMRFGGTGTQSEHLRQPSELPHRYESGSLNAIGIAGLRAAADWLLNESVGNVEQQEREITGALLVALQAIDGAHVYGPTTAQNRVGVISVTLDGFDPAELSAMLETQFGILTRSGLHCAPLAHKAIGTFDSGGTTRFSVGPFVTSDHVAGACAAMSRISMTHRARA